MPLTNRADPWLFKVSTFASPPGTGATRHIMSAPSAGKDKTCSSAPPMLTFALLFSRMSSVRYSMSSFQFGRDVQTFHVHARGVDTLVCRFRPLISQFQAAGIAQGGLNFKLTEFNS